MTLEIRSVQADHPLDGKILVTITYECEWTASSRDPYLRPIAITGPDGKEYPESDWERMIPTAQDYTAAERAVAKFDELTAPDWDRVRAEKEDR
jgi:hypothetical protein